MRKLISFDDETFASLTELGRNRMATIQEIADEAFRDVLKKHNMPRDLRDALRKSVKAGAHENTAKTSGRKAAVRARSSKTASSPRSQLAKRKTR